MSWQRLLDQANLSIEAIKDRLPLEWVVLEAGVVMDRSADGRLVGECPFHPDSNPSFAIFGDDLDRVGCWSCDFSSGDLFDFIQRWRSIPFKDAVKEAVKLLERFESDGTDFRPTPAQPSTPVDPEVIRAEARSAYRLGTQNLEVLRGFIDAKGLGVGARWLHEEFLVGAVSETEILIPHLVVDPDGDLVVTAYKTRSAASHPYARSGSRFLDVYGAWRDRGHDQVIICEGESDTWKLAWTFKENEYDVFGLPAGANQAPKAEWLDRFRGRDVTLLMDGDAPGRAAARRWHVALLPSARSVRIAALDDGADACSTQLSLRRVVGDAVEVPLWTGNVQVANSGTHYIRAASGAAVCNWALRLERLITLDEGGSALEGVIVGTDERVVITSEDLSSETNARRWSNRHDRVWLGSTKDAQSLWEYLLRDGPFLARGWGSRVAGWHDDHLVLPGITLGPKHWIYVEPPTTPGVDRLVGRLNGLPTDTEVDARALLAGLSLHVPGVVTPVVAWLAAAPLRSLFTVFPPLAVVGGAGTGKTTLISELLRLFGWAGNEFNLTSSTPYGVSVLSSATNGVPVWFDEYRATNRRDTKDAFEQTLRNAWTGSSSMRGGVNRNASELVSNAALAPIIVSGEDTFSETSHAERLVIVNVPPEGKNTDALGYLRGPGAANGLGAGYHAWLVDQAQRGTLGGLKVPYLDRPLQGEAVLGWGWHLLGRYVGETMNTSLPELDLERVRATRELTLSVTPVVDVVSYGLHERDRQGAPLCWVEQDDVLVRVRSLVQVDRDGPRELPGGERAIADYLRDAFPGAASERTNYGRALRLPGAREVIENAGLG